MVVDHFRHCVRVRFFIAERVCPVVAEVVLHAIEGDGDCFYSSIVEAFRREGVSLCSLELKSSTKSLVTGVKCLRLCVASALTPETFEVLQQHQQVLLMFFGSFLSSQTDVPRQG